MTALDVSTDTHLDAVRHPNDGFLEEATLDANHGVRALRGSGTLPPGATVVIAERIPGDEAALVFEDLGPWVGDDPIPASVRAFDATTSDPTGLVELLAARPELTTVVHLRSPYIQAWARSGRPLPIRYVPVQRWTLASELPLHDDPARSLATFVADQLAANPHTPAILTATGAVVWGTRGLLPTLEYAQLVEEGAQVQVLAQPLGGSLPVGPGVLIQQWKMSGLETEARAAGLLSES